MKHSVARYLRPILRDRSVQGQRKRAHAGLNGRLQQRGESPRWLVWNAAWMGATALTTMFCFVCRDRVKLADGGRGPYSECEVCGEPAGVDWLVLKMTEQRLLKGERDEDNPRLYWDRAAG